ncbi:lipid A biosynthesis acyltransferase [Xanthocytophaga agilis]|uniref:Lipid A biosynthesis acyltransferase n=1 Tax=Xanthocytophaga agilis TaxID=3048010 RepID=A0AAE3UF41_9BACT|nr:lipid A biosynthesis acyltransferase [Xanthocytophaga agilis]MDJ1500163.1 lipid A biosynthesis acyltransferase [Xanthocytophaga agilis]
MSVWSGQSKGTVLGYKIFVFILSYLGLLPAYFILYFVALYYFLFSNHSSKVIYSYLHDRLKFSKTASLVGIYRNYFVFGQSLIDRVAVLAGYSRFHYHFDGEQYLEQMCLSGSGGILISAHLGNWEIAGHLLQKFSCTINIVMYDGEHQKIKSYLESVKGSSRIRIIAIKEDLSHIYQINEALERKELLCIHGDRFTTGARTISVQFLGKEALFPIGPYQLAARYNVPVSFVFSTKQRWNKYHLKASEPIYIPSPRTSNHTEQLTHSVHEYIRQIEKTIRLYPYQWFNYYDFWKVDLS